MNLDWKVCYIKDGQETERIAATVPGAVQLDYARAFGYDDYHYADNYLQFKWMEDVFWKYTADIPFFSLKDDEELFFVCKGIDYQYDIFVDEEKLYSHEGMFSPVCLDITRFCSGGELSILIYPAPKKEGAHKDTRAEASQSCKPAVNYGWDFCPRLIPLGIWDEACIEIRNVRRFENCDVSYELSESFDEARIVVDAALNIDMNGADAVFCLMDKDGNVAWEQHANVVGSGVRVENNFSNPKLWWCNGYGEPYLYKYSLVVTGCETAIVYGSVGFRKIRLVMSEGAWYEQSFPVTRSPAPATIEINGRTVFAKGSNWVCPEVFPGVLTEDIYKNLLEMAANELHFNILRCWGGAIVNKDSFFDICDRLGILVWQEFPLACNNYSGTKKYLSVLDAESRAIILRLRRHACIAIWCGGNELFNFWSGMTDQSLALRLLNKNCYELSPDIPFNYTSPLYGMGHGCYLFKYPNGEEVYTVMQKSKFTAYSEFGVPSAAVDEEYIKTFIPSDELFPLTNSKNAVVHHGFGSWGYGDKNDAWLCLSILESYFGKPESLNDIIQQSHWLQSEGYKAIFEESRRQKPYCSMALNWCYNEPWKTLANNSIISYPNIRKPAFYAVSKSCRPILASARIKKFSWCSGEEFEAEIWMLNDSYESDGISGNISAYIFVADEKIPAGRWAYSLCANKNAMIGVCKLIFPATDATEFILLLESDTCAGYNSEYRLQHI